MKNKKLFMVVMLPFCLLLFLIARAEYHLSKGVQWDFAITGYDPRDLLRGHYLLFRVVYDWEKEKNQCKNKNDCSYCLSDTGNQVPKVHIADTFDAKKCDGYMQYRSGQPILNRFYIAETKAQAAESLLRQARINQSAYIRISLNSNGVAQIVDLLIDGKPLNDALKSNKVR